MSEFSWRYNKTKIHLICEHLPIVYNSIYEKIDGKKLSSNLFVFGFSLTKLSIRIKNVFSWTMVDQNFR